MTEEEEVMKVAEEFDAMSCHEQVRLVLNMLTDAAREDDMDKVRAALIPLVTRGRGVLRRLSMPTGSRAG